MEALLKHALRVPAVLITIGLFALALTADSPRGVVEGKVLGRDGKPLAGVKMTLSRPPAAPLKAMTDATGLYRFPSVLPAADYTVKAELADYKTSARANVVVRIAGRSTVNLVLEAGKPEEQTVISVAFPTVDPVRRGTRADFSQTELQTLPTARNPWVVLQLVPGVMIDREDMGGSESANFSVLTARGDDNNGANNVWRVDGVDVSDPVDLGLPLVPFDFDAIDTISVTTGGSADVTIPTGGIIVNVLNRRGENKVAGAVRFNLTDNAFQGSNLTETLRNLGVAGTNKIDQIKDYGANVGGPLLRDHIWLWGSYGVQDIHNFTIFNDHDQALFPDYHLKLDIQAFGGNRFEAMYMAGSKTRYGADPSIAKPEGNRVTGRFRLGNPVFKLQDEQSFGNDLLLAVKYTLVNAGSRVRPMTDEDLVYPVTVDIARDAYVPYGAGYDRTWDASSERRKRSGWEFAATLYKDDLLGLAHEFKGGFEFVDKSLVRQTGYSQNFLVQRNFNEPLFDLGDGLIVPPADYQYITFGRESRDNLLLSQASAYLQDTISSGRFTLTVGFRYDRQKPTSGAYGLASILPFSTAWKSVFFTDTIDALGELLPGISVRAIDPRYRWSTWSPRIGLSWDVKGNGRTVVKLSLAQYGDLMALGDFTSKPLGLGGSLGFWWQDADADGLIDYEETYWKHSSVYAESPNLLYHFLDENGDPTEEATAALVGGFESDAYLAGNYKDFDWSNPRAVNYDYLTTFYRSDIDPEAKNVKTSPRTREIVLSLEKELRPDLTASVAATYRRYDNFDWVKLFYPADVYPSTPDLVIDNSQAWYEAAGIIPQKITITDDQGNVTKEYDLLEAGGKTWSLPIASFPGETPYRMVDKSKSYRTYVGLDLGITKRLSDRWLANASVTLQDQRAHWNGSYIDPTNQWALDGKPYGNIAPGPGGKVAIQMYARWMAKFMALYQMPLGITVSATFQAREGWKIPNYITLAFANEESWPGLYRSNIAYLESPTKDHLPVYRNLSFRLEKSVKVGANRMVLGFDVFNVFNWATVNRAYDAYLGTYYVDTDEFVANPYYRLDSEILNPRVFRLGVRFEF
jgi:Carboxypeptidase regulatory-like domain/TonB-dependent Receptor Plug Domain